ncbi:hypothetical protein [Spirosoma litoris]
MQTIPTQIDLNGFENLKPDTDIYVLSGNLVAENTPSKPTRHKTVHTKVVLKGASPVYDFPAYSYTILKFRW